MTNAALQQQIERELDRLITKQDELKEPIVDSGLESNTSLEDMPVDARVRFATLQGCQEGLELAKGVVGDVLSR